MLISKRATELDKGKVRIKTYFSWFPVRMTDGSLIWMERYNQKESGVEGCDGWDEGGNGKFWWSVDKKERII